MKQPTIKKEASPPPGIMMHVHLTADGLVLDQGPAWFWKQFIDFCSRLGYNSPKKNSGDKTDVVVCTGKVYDTLRIFKHFSKTWRFNKLLSYIRIREYNKVPLLDREETQGQYHCHADILFEGSDNDLGNTAYCILRVNFVIRVGQNLEHDSSVIKLDARNTVQIVKSPMDFLIEQNYPIEDREPTEEPPISGSSRSEPEATLDEGA